MNRIPPEIDGCVPSHPTPPEGDDQPPARVRPPLSIESSDDAPIDETPALSRYPWS